MPIKDNREYRSFGFETRAEGADGKKECRVCGYAATFERYKLFSMDGVDYFEEIDSKAFDEADMSDIIFLYNHEGMVFARQRNKTLECRIDEHGLYIEADLSSTEQSRSMFEQISAGLVDQMSFAFTVREDAYDKETHTRKILKIEKCYDVSAVSIPANPGTEIGVKSRSLFDGWIEQEQAERLAHEERIAALKAEFKNL